MDVLTQEVRRVMTPTKRPDNTPHVGGYLVAMMTPRPDQPAGYPSWPGGLRCDAVSVPLDGCCGVIAHLAGAGVTVCPIAQLGGWMVFLAADGSVASCADLPGGLPPGLTVHGAVDRFPIPADPDDATGCWVVPPAGANLPPAVAILSALRSAFADYRAARSLKIV